MTADALRLDDVVVAIGGVRLLDGVSLRVAPGRIVAVVGANGAGKTTMLDAICGTIEVASGAVAIDGRVNGERAGTPRSGVGRVFQGSPLPDTLTVGEVLALVAPAREETVALLDRFGLREHLSSFVSELSTGMRRILDLAVASVGSPAVLLLDEPASGLAQAEIERLAEVLRGLRDETGAGVVIVEHDAWLVREVADEIVVLDAGRVVARGKPTDVFDVERAKSVARLRSPADPRFHDALERVSAGAVPTPPLVKRSLSTWTLLRLGLREFAAGLAAVMILGVLNRVMKVELGISLGVVAAVLASYNLAAPLALPIGHRSDTRPIFGRRRVPYIIGGAAVTGVAVVLAPHVAGRLADGLTVVNVLPAVVLFVLMGIGMYGSGTVFFALVADKAPPDERGHAASIVYLELLAGILAGVALTGAVIDDEASNLGVLFALAGVLVVVLTSLAVWGQEEPLAPDQTREAAEPEVSFRIAIRSVWRLRQARLFFGFMVAATIFIFLQQAILEPFGGDVFGMTVRQTSAFNAMMTAGTVIGMLVAGRPFVEQFGHKRMARVGLFMGTGAFAWLAFAATSQSVAPAWLAIFAIGLATGVFNVAGLALMMGMADRRRTALFLGAWTVAHALADGVATAGGGVFYDVLRAFTGGDATAYGLVFAVEAAGLLLCVPLLAGIDPAKFQEELAAEEPPEGAMRLVEAAPLPLSDVEHGAAEVAAPAPARRPVAVAVAVRPAKPRPAQRGAARKPSKKPARKSPPRRAR